MHSTANCQFYLPIGLTLGEKESDIIIQMVKALLFDFSRVLLFPKDTSYAGSLNEKHKELSKTSDYKILDHFFLNDELLNFLQGLKEKYILCLFTSETIQDAPEFSSILNSTFKKSYSGIKLGITKKDSVSYTAIAKDLSLSPEEILFIDDSWENLQAAQKAGLDTIQYSSNEQVVEGIKTKLHHQPLP